MYMAALEFLEDEREAWRPFEALADLTDLELERPTDAESDAHGWTGRDLMSHLAGWYSYALEFAKELAIGQTSPTRDRMDREWDAKGADGMNAELATAWAPLGMDEVRKRFGEIPGELRGHLTVVPESRWLKDASMQRTFAEYTFEHAEEHLPDLRAILAAAGRPPDRPS